MENRHGLLVDFLVTAATGTAERDVVPQLIDDALVRGFHPKTLGADKGYDTRECVQALRAQGVTPHVAQNTTGRRSAVDGRTTRGPGYIASQKVRRRIEIVCSQLTKTRVRAGLASRDDVPDLHHLLSYDHPVHQQLHPLRPLFERRMFESAGQLIEQ